MNWLKVGEGLDLDLERRLAILLSWGKVRRANVLTVWGIIQQSKAQRQRLEVAV
jgi:hypothetical protein